MSGIDFVVVVVYLLVVGAIGLVTSRKQETTLRYFLADRQMPQ